jgi:cell division protein FtsB
MEPTTNFAGTGHDESIRLFLRKLTVLLTLKHWLMLATLWCFGWGVVALSLRAALATPRKSLLFGIGGILVAAMVAVWMARKQLPSHEAVRSLLDRQNESGGLLMTAGEQPLGAWDRKLSTIQLPQLRWRSARAWGLMALSASFVAICLLLPIQYVSGIAGRSLNVTKEAETIAAQIETLKESQIITETKAEELNDKLDQLVADAIGEDPAKTWEALDHLANSVEKASQDALANAAGKQQQLDKAEALAEGLVAGSDQMDAQLMTEAMKTLSTMMQGAMANNEALASQLSKETQEAIKNGSLNSEQLKEVANALSQSKQKLNQQLSKLNQSGMNRGKINPNSLKGGASANKRDNSGLSKFLKENAQKMSVADAVGQWCEGNGDKSGNGAGRGGVVRGRGDAAMTWTEGSDESNAKFKEKALPPGAVAGLQDSQLVGLSASAPEVQKGNLAAHGALNNSIKGGGSAYTQTVLPKHKRTVQKYFDRR